MTSAAPNKFNIVAELMGIIPVSREQAQALAEAYSSDLARACDAYLSGAWKPASPSRSRDEANGVDVVEVMDSDEEATKHPSPAMALSTNVGASSMRPSSKKLTSKGSTGSSAAGISAWLHGGSSLKSTHKAPRQPPVVQGSACSAGFATSATLDTIAPSRAAPQAGDTAHGGGGPRSTPSAFVSTKDNHAVFPISGSYRSVDTPLADYDPLAHACWPPREAAANDCPSSSASTRASGSAGAAAGKSAIVAGAEAAQDAPFLHLARAFACIEPVFGRIRIANMLVNTFRTLLLAAPRAVLPALFLTTGQLGSSYDPLVLSIGGRIMTDSMVAALGSTPARISTLYKETGDLGDVGAVLTKSKPRSLIAERPLGVAELWRKVELLCGLKGAGSGDRRKAEVQGLLRRCREHDEVRYLIRFLVLNMRIHVNTVTAVLALAQAVAYQEATGERRVELHEEGRLATVGKTATWRGEPRAGSAVAGAGGDLSTLGSEVDADVAGPADSSPGDDDEEGGDESEDEDEDGRAATSAPSSSSAAAPQSRSQGTKRPAAAGKAGAAAAAIRGTAADMRAVPEPVKSAMQRAAAVARRCLSKCPNLDRLVNSLVRGGVPAMVSCCRASAGTPIKPMLARITQGIGELGERFAGRAFTCEWKYDGQRAQIHYSAAGFADADRPVLDCPSRAAAGAADLADAGPRAALTRSPHRSSNRYGTLEASAIAARPSPATDRLVRVFSRHLDNTTARWPDCVSAVLAAAIAPDTAAGSVPAALADDSRSSVRIGTRVAGVQPVTSFIIDCELVAVKMAAPVSAAGGEAGSSTGPQAVGALSSAASTAAASGGLTGAAADPALAGIVSPSLVDSHGSEFDPHEGFSILPFQVLSTRSRPTDIASAGLSDSSSRVAQGQAQLFGPPPAATDSAVRESEDIRGRSDSSCVGADSATRERADDTTRDDKEPAAPDGVNVCVLAFDLMLLNGKPLLHFPLRQRRELLRTHFRVVPGRFSFAKGIDVDLRTPSSASSSNSTGLGSAAGATSSDAVDYQEQVWAVAQERVSEELHAAFRGSCEGIMVKLLDNEGSATQSTLPTHAGGRLAVGTAVPVGTKRPRTAASNAPVLGSPPQRLPAKKPRGADASDSGANYENTQVSAAAESTGDTVSAGVLASVTTPLLMSTSAGATACAASRSGGAALVATYQPDVRSNAWLKVKRDYVEGLADTLDVVPIGGWYGNGRKAGWISPVLFGIYNPQTQRYQSLCRCMSGFTDAFYRDAAVAFMRPDVLLTEAEARRMYDTGESPPLWFRPLEVWEIKGADFTLSPVHAAAAGLVHPSRGISLRFPRFLRKRLLEDKGPTDATTPAQLAELYRGQSRRLDGTHAADTSGAERGKASGRSRGRSRHMGALAGAGGGDEDGSAYPFIGDLGDDDDVDADD
jgi:ATP-dependent DNA ligase